MSVIFTSGRAGVPKVHRHRTTATRQQ